MHYLCIIGIICIFVYLSRVRRNSPRGPAWCWRRIPVDRSARGVYDSDAYCSGSAHAVPMLVRCRRCMSMAMRELNSPEQWMHLNPTACGAFAFAGALSPVRDAGMRIPEVVFTMQFKLNKLKFRVSIYGGLPRCTPYNYKICKKQNRADECKLSPVHGVL